MEQGTWLLILNPVSGNGKALRKLPLLHASLAHHNLSWQDVRSEGPGHIEAIAAQAYAEGQRRFLIAGGDGSFHEAMNGIGRNNSEQLRDTTFALCSTGTGNDWVRTLEVPSDANNLAFLMAHDYHFTQDVGTLQSRVDGVDRHTLFCNIAGLGFDGYVAHTVHKNVRKGHLPGKTAYLMALVGCLLRYKSVRATIDMDGSMLDEKIFSLAVAICRFNGGGMMQAPKAEPDDGLLDYTLIRNLSVAQVVANLPGLYSGRFINHPKVSVHTGTRLHVPTEGIPVEADGEPAGTTPATFGLLPRYLRVISPKIQ